MIALIARLKVQPGQESAFKAEAAKMVDYVRASEPDTTLYLCLQSKSDPTSFAFYEEYANDAALATHGGSDAMKTFFGAVGGMLDGQPSMDTFTEADAKR